ADALIDLVHQHDGVLDQHPRQRQQAQQRGEGEGHIRRQKPRADAADRHRHDQPDDQRLTHALKQDEAGHQHHQEAQRQHAAQRFIRFAGRLMLPAPLQRVTMRQLNAAHDFCKARKRRGRSCVF
ncbi:unnamed protein product, partial [Chrysoparadoxa australica]